MVFFDDVEPQQYMGLQIQPWGENPVYTIPLTKTMYQVIQENACIDKSRISESIAHSNYTF